MTLQVVCKNGHIHNTYDIYKDWPDGWPKLTDLGREAEIPDSVNREADESLRVTKRRQEHPLPTGIQSGSSTTVTGAGQGYPWRTY